MLITVYTGWKTEIAKYIDVTMGLYGVQITDPETAAKFAFDIAQVFKPLIEDDIAPADIQLFNAAPFVGAQMVKGALNDVLLFDRLIRDANYCLRSNCSGLDTQPPREIPACLANFIADVIEGKIKRPRKSGPDIATTLSRNDVLVGCTEYLVKKYKLQQYSNNELSTHKTAAEYVSEASGYGIDIVITAIKKSNRANAEELLRGEEDGQLYP
jgi:hypothetical protein